MYRLSDKYGEAELVQWVERQREFGDEMSNWFGGIAVGAICTLVVLWALGAF